MFKQLTNEAVLTFTLRNEGPLLINSGSAAKIQPRMDMSFVRTVHNGDETVYLPGSSIKGVFRSRYEQVMRMLGGDKAVCDLFDRRESGACSKKIEKKIKEAKKEKKDLDGSKRYELSCEACKLFGSLVLGGRITFADAYPVDGKWKVSTRHGVGIDRITGAASPGALYDIEVLESGAFTITCKLASFKIYQLRVILWILEDIDEGLVTFGMGGSRGNGQMRITDRAQVRLVYRKYPGDKETIKGEGTETLFGKQIEVCGLPEIIAATNINTKEELKAAIPSHDGR